MIKAIAHRSVGNKWCCAFGWMALYVGGSANKADDLAKLVNGGLAEGATATAQRREVKGKKAWTVVLGIDGAGPIIKVFGNSANKADDFAKEFNVVVASAPRQEDIPASMPQAPVPDGVGGGSAEDPWHGKSDSMDGKDMA